MQQGRWVTAGNTGADCVSLLAGGRSVSMPIHPSLSPRGYMCVCVRSFHISTATLLINPALSFQEKKSVCVSSMSVTGMIGEDSCCCCYWSFRRPWPLHWHREACFALFTFYVAASLLQTRTDLTHALLWFYLKQVLLLDPTHIAQHMTTGSWTHTHTKRGQTQHRSFPYVFFCKTKCVHLKPPELKLLLELNFHKNKHHKMFFWMFLTVYESRACNAATF